MKFEFVYFFNFKQENFNDNHLNGTDFVTHSWLRYTSQVSYKLRSTLENPKVFWVLKDSTF